MRQTKYSTAVQAELDRIKAQKEKKYNALGRWFNSNAPAIFDVEITDMKAVMR